MNIVNKMKMKIIKYLLIYGLLLIPGFSFSQTILKVKVTDLERIIKNSNTPMIIDFWATFCKPCAEEIPYFQEAVKKHKKDSVKLLLVSLDLEDYYPKKIRNFAVKEKYIAPIVWLDESNADYFCPRVDTSWSGAIPATLFINNKTGYRRFFEDQLSKEKLEKEILALIGTSN